MANLLSWLAQIFLPFTFWDALDILVVALGLYLVLRLVRGTRAVPLIMGSVAVALIVMLTDQLHLQVSHWILISVLQSWVIALIILFQPEIRMLVEQLGRGRFIAGAFPRPKGEDVVGTVNKVVLAARRLSERKIGALIALEREVGLNDIITTGRRITGDVSAELLQTIFHPGTAMHDGGVVIQHDRISAAMCLFPLSAQEHPRQFGTRHRAALGLSEVTDAVVVVVSEETGTVSLAVNGHLQAGLSLGALKEQMLALLQPQGAEAVRWFWKREPAQPKREVGTPGVSASSTGGTPVPPDAEEGER
jgi:diadenylate cyclase